MLAAPVAIGGKDLVGLTGAPETVLTLVVGTGATTIVDDDPGMTNALLVAGTGLTTGTVLIAGSET